LALLFRFTDFVSVDIQGSNGSSEHEQKKMSLQGESIELKKKVFTPAENILDELSLEAVFIDLRADGYVEDHLFLKRFELFFRKKY
jgi:hypothetical protein